MKKLTVACIGTPAAYLRQRRLTWQSIIEHKKTRRVALGPNVSLHFEDYMTMKHQVQEMMRIENLSNEEAIAAELEVYNPMIPDGSNLKCTLMIEFPDPVQRQHALRELVGLEHQVFVRIGTHEAVGAIADEDLSRSTSDKTSAVHFLRFEFCPAMIATARTGASWSIFSQHPAYPHRVEPLPADITRSLSQDFA